MLNIENHNQMILKAVFKTEQAIYYKHLKIVISYISTQ